MTNQVALPTTGDLDQNIPASLTTMVQVPPDNVMPKLSQERGQEAIAAVLRYGSLAATVVMSLGLALLLFRGTAGPLPAYHRIRLAQLFPSLIKQVQVADLLDPLWRGLVRRVRAARHVI